MKFQNWVDEFTLKARVMPALVASSPLLLYLIYKNIIVADKWSTGLLAVIFISIMLFFSVIGRDLGKKIEARMYKRLGAKSTTIILSHKDQKINQSTKKRYHQKISKQIPEINIPSSLQDELENGLEVYDTAINYLRVHANANRDEYPLVFAELIKYNFSRNLLGLKPLALVLCMLIGIREFLTIDPFLVQDVFLKPYPEYISLIGMIVSILFLTFGITKKSVEEKSFDYAKTLVEVSEHIN